MSAGASLALVADCTYSPSEEERLEANTFLRGQSDRLNSALARMKTDIASLNNFASVTSIDPHKYPR
jgi:hypothetical protein